MFGLWGRVAGWVFCLKVGCWKVEHKSQSSLDLTGLGRTVTSLREGRRHVIIKHIGNVSVDVLHIILHE